MINTKFKAPKKFLLKMHGYSTEIYLKQQILRFMNNLEMNKNFSTKLAVLRICYNAYKIIIKKWKNKVKILMHGKLTFKNSNALSLWNIIYKLLK